MDGGTDGGHHHVPEFAGREDHGHLSASLELPAYSGGLRLVGEGVGYGNGIEIEMGSVERLHPLSGMVPDGHGCEVPVDQGAPVGDIDTVAVHGASDVGGDADLRTGDVDPAVLDEDLGDLPEILGGDVLDLRIPHIGGMDLSLSGHGVSLELGILRRVPEDGFRHPEALVHGGLPVQRDGCLSLPAAIRHAGHHTAVDLGLDVAYLGIVDVDGVDHRLGGVHLRLLVSGQGLHGPVCDGVYHCPPPTIILARM